MKSLNYPEVFSLHGEVALITGGGTGIGLAVGHAMHAAGATVVLVGRREAELKAAVKDMGARAKHIVHDITRLEQTDALVERVKAEAGPVTCLVNNAGVHLKKPAVDTTAEEFQTVLTTHVIAAHMLSRAVIPGMIARKHGTILYMTSMAGLFGIPLVVAYSAAKSAHLGMVRTLSTELSSRGIRVNGIAPGWIESEMMRKALAGDPARMQKILGRTPAGRLGQPEEVAWAAVYLASPAAKFITGVVLPVDGGASIGF